MKRLLAILCALACLCALCVPALATEETVTIRAHVPSNWTTAFLYVWKGETPAVEWPGMEMTSEGNSWFSAQIPTDMNYAIVNDGNGTQTADLEILAGVDQWIVMGGDVSSVEVLYQEPAADELPDNTPGAKPEGNFTVHAQVPEAWASAYVWAWDDTDTSAFEAWPGLAMTEDSDGNYTAEVPAWCNHLLIAEKDGGAQSIDLTVSGVETWIVVSESADGGKCAAVTSESGYPGEISDITVHAMVPAEWSNVRVWAWKDGTNLATTDWPGELAMTQDEDGWYTLTIAGWVTGVLINADSTDGSVAQTGDLTVESGTEIWIDATTDPSNAVVSTTKPDVTVPTLPDPTEPPATDAPATKPAATDAPKTDGASNNGSDASDSAEQPKDYSVVIVIVFVIVSACAIGGALLYKKKKQ